MADADPDVMIMESVNNVNRLSRSSADQISPDESRSNELST